MLLVPAIHETGAECAFDADQIFLLIDAGNGKTSVTTAHGVGMTLNMEFAVVLKAIEDAEDEREDDD